ncbi:hypothetical protein ACC785_38245, partial [Rhizobium ruizarguesonis]
MILLCPDVGIDERVIRLAGDGAHAAIEHQETEILKIRQRFGDWKAVGPAQTKEGLGALVTKGETAEVIVIPGDITSI